MGPVIKVENLSKKFIIAHEQQEKYTALRDVMVRKAKKIFSFPFRIVKSKTIVTREEFWALKDLSFDIQQGDRVGIIGRNGAGKSTLLKVLSRITEPSSGRIKIKGRVASLLEVGTGFHPELTGRENIYLNGAILGMNRAEIRKKFDEIVSFAEVEKFLDTPVKRYSSGMYVRLAFAVAAHLEPEILIVDEVLAVGDAQFQKKCLGKMEDVSNDEGRTILFVSHNLDAIKQLCNSGILLLQGKIAEKGNINKVIDAYLQKGNHETIEFPYDGKKPKITRATIDNESIKKGNFKVEIHFKSPFKLNVPNVGVLISTKFGSPVFGTNSKLHAVKGNGIMSEGIATLEIPNLPLHSDNYNVSLFLGDSHMDFDYLIDIMNFSFVSNLPIINYLGERAIGPLNLIPNWEYLNQQ